MIGDTIRELREKAGLSQSELARRLSVTRASVNAWEGGLSAPTAVYLVALAQLFHVSTDYLLGLDTGTHIDLAGLKEEEVQIIYRLLAYFDSKK